ncbi:transcription initiation factor TFIID subunit 3 isoform X2 [Sebastes umbrosus]|uniref:transcription initiation factor TFIID subunit 3 isoform X2 n=1 Tax=Sebastes umbrosus TaxID=72105 RepID=UPI00189CBA76|nr:transcription initiation factor TFIID subunit 3 isoform X2 [Sebastes umbrosus]
MCESYARSLLRVSVAQICQALGWDAVQLTACDQLSDVLHRYIQQLARVCHRYSELYGRTDPVLDDVSQAFRLLGVSLSELEDYVHNLEPVAFAQQTPLFPVSKNNVLQFPQPGARDAEERKDYIPDHMPPLVSLQEEEEEEEVLADMGTSAEAMQVALEEDDEEMDDDETVNDENHPLKRHLDSPDAAMGMMPTSKRPRMYTGLSPEWGVEPREPLTSLNPQRVPPGMLPSHDSLDPLSPETPSGVLPSFRPQPVTPKHSDQKGLTTPGRKSKVSSPGRQRTKSPKGVVTVPVSGSPIHSPKPSKEKKKSPGRTKSPKSPKSPKMVSAKTSQPQSKTDVVHKLPLCALSERMGKENIHMRQNIEDRELAEGPFKKLEPDNAAIDDSIDSVIARACAEREPDPFAFSSGSDSDSNGFSSPRRLTIMEPSTPKLSIGISVKDTSTPLHLQTQAGPGNWTMDDSINEVIRKVNQGGPSAPPPHQGGYISSGSASPPTPEPLLKVFEEKIKIATVDVKKKLKKELKTKMKKKEKDKPKDKEREKDKGKLKEKNKDKNRDKNKDKEGKMSWKEFGVRDDEHFLQRDFTLPEGSIKIKTRDVDVPKKEKEKHKDKKKDKEKSKKDKDKKDKGKDRSKEDRQNKSAFAPFALGELPALFSPSACLRIPSMLPPLAPILQDKDIKSKEKDKKKDKKEKKKKKDKEKDKEREKAKEKEREKEEKRKEKEREKEKREKEKEKEKERIRLEKVKVDTPAALLSPVIPRLTLKVGAGQDKIVISKVVPNSEPKTPTPKTPAAKSGPGNRPRTPPPAPVLLPVIPTLPPPPSPLPPAPAPSSLLCPAPTSFAASFKTPVRSVVTETVSTYVIRDEWGNQIWICPGCNKADDGSPMIGCDDCDDWYHWPCVGMLTAPPEDQQWFCVKCSSKKKDKKHKKRKHKLH